jgi:hypothetical protein
LLTISDTLTELRLDHDPTLIAAYRSSHIRAAPSAEVPPPVAAVPGRRRLPNVALDLVAAPSYFPRKK